MILIHAWADGSFTTQHGGPDMQAWAEHEQAAKHGCVATWLSPKGPDGGSFREAFDQLAARDLEHRYGDPILGKWHKSPYSIWPNAQAWQLWASVCISDFGAWFEKVTGPAKEDVLRERLARLIGTRGECSFGVLVNLVRPIAPSVVYGALETMRRFGLVERIERPNPRNKITASLYRLSQPS